ncbi:cation-translocating P-type ATPase [Geodermatophilus sabuli]|uniref:Ca2+-transporting ATPase n=1 Tax=Geodermatophilus sabuli TaxID=1564158 RepID=A0A285EH13_9ACTN|nr:cation-transporting P-type ATPase [Geodermatophilus sabuli]MBB3084484.1 Ca2+-transporting ATPase [Geodermatophilus sabuli]SNX97321.1 Ca2+-transporting ATPase [Geodermatophilus sabuli]
MSAPTNRVSAQPTIPVQRTASAGGLPPYLCPAEQVVIDYGADVQSGLTHREAAQRLQEIGPNRLTSEKPPSIWAVALSQLRDPMNIMLIVVAVASLLISQVSTAVLVAALVLLNVLLGTRQDMKARASVDALSKLQVPQSRVLREGQLEMIPAEEVVPGDVVRLEAGDIVPADGRVVAAATLETQEAALTGESAPISKGAETLAGPDVGLGDRVNMLFQNTSVTRGTASMVVTATGMQTEMGKIATMLTSVDRTRSPLQKELDGLTRLLGIVAWTAVALIVVVGLARDLPIEDVLLLGTAMAISAIPTGLPTFVQAMLSFGARQLAEAKAVVKNLTDVETLGATSVINTDKTGTLTLNQMMVSTLYVDGAWFTVDGEGYRKSGGIRAVAGSELPDFTRLAYALVLDSDATVGDDGAVIGDPTEAALVVLAAKLGVDADQTRRAYPRLAEVPFDSEYKFMATFHRVEIDGAHYVVELVKGAPDVVLGRCSTAGGPFRSPAVPIGPERDRIEAANRHMGEQGLRVLAFAARLVRDDEVAVLQADPMALTTELGFVGMVGIIDPLRPSAKAAVETALRAGIDVRMITGDHAVTAHAIGSELGLGEGAISGAELQALSDEELRRRLPRLHVFGRVTPEDKLRLARIMQGEGQIVAMTGDAVNDAAALKQADIGVAMGSGSEVSKQAARMILTDDNFGTLVHAVELGRSIYGKVVSYIRYQMTQLLSLVLLFVTATVFNINSGVAMTPLMVLFLNFFVAIFPVVVILLDPADPEIMDRPPRDPKVAITNLPAVTRWIVYGAVLFLAGLVPLVAGPDQPSTDVASASMTMCYVVIGLGTIFSGVVMRRDPTSGLTPPILTAVKWSVIPAGLLVLSTELDFLQNGLLAQSLTGLQWLACIGLALVMPIVVELDKWVHRRRLHPPAPVPVEVAVTPARATATA